MKRFLVTVAVLALVFMCFISTANGETLRYLYALEEAEVYLEDSVFSECIGILEKNEIVYGIDFLVGEDGSHWVLAETAYGRGYVSENLLGYCADEVYQVTALLKLNKSEFVRTSPTGEVYKRLSNGTKIDVVAMYPTEYDGTWAAINLEDGRNGYLPASSLCKLDGSKLGEFPRDVLLKRDTFAREKASFGAERVNIVYIDTHVSVEYYIIVSDRTIWALCDDEQGNRIGFICIDDLKAFT